MEEGSCSGGHFSDKEMANESLQFCEELVLLYRLAGTYLAEVEAAQSTSGGICEATGTNLPRE